MINPSRDQVTSLVLAILLAGCSGGAGYQTLDISIDLPTGDSIVDGTGDGSDTGVDTGPGDVPGDCSDSDGDGVCDADDACPGFDDSADEDMDTVPDGCDLCPGGDDREDEDGDGTPDYCDCDGSGITCDPHATCFNTETGPTCVCNEGWEGDGLTCTDIDECTLGTHTCDTNATCANTEGSYDCTCNAGWEGDGFTCTDVDECTLGTHTCDTNATCTNTDGGYDCTCNAGYDGDGFTCTDIDECSLGTDTCDTNATCLNTVGSYTCVCNPGYTGDGFTCTDVDECATGTHGCHTYATCTNTPGGYTCACITGYSGDGYTCRPIDHCSAGTDTCDTNATCTYTGPGTYTCSCNSGYSGDGFTCTPINHCTAGTHTCHTNARCIYTGPGTYNCVCDTGYSGDGFTCTPIDHCSAGTDTCDVNATCTYTGPGTYSCTCNTGYTGSGYTCTPINHCTAGTDTCDVNATCTYTGPGTYTCACNSGYTGTGYSCTDINECSTGTHTCDINATCTNTPGSYTCACNSGYVGDGFTCTPTGGGCHTYSESIPSGTLSSSSPQCTGWNTWRAGLPSSGLITATMSGTFDTTGRTCTDPTTVQAMANALRTGGSGSWTCDGNSWAVGLCGSSSYAISANAGVCSCLTPDYVARPCINNLNWGGINTASCSSPTQTITVDFCDSGGSSGCDAYSESFPSGTLPSSSPQCTNWNSWRTGLSSSGVTSINARGSMAPTGLTCSVPATAQAIADALRTGGTGSWSCDGHTWYVGACGGTALSIDITVCTCITSGGYSVRPCINNANWGGMTTAVCSAPAQDMTVEVCGGGSSGGALVGTARMTSGSWIPVRYEICGSGSPGSCTAAAAKAACTSVGEQVLSHASNGTSEVLSLGATTSCNFSDSYFTVSTTAPAGSCLVGISNLDWSSCCGLTRWHGNTLDFGAAGAIFGYVYSTNSGYVSTYPNVDGQHWGCTNLTTAASNRTGCTQQYVACTN